ncbi:MAG: methionine--tRNA ligase [Chloroflexota bacterium]|nr:methionine--tRNA ligase [Chloroflexota bacterium]
MSEKILVAVAWPYANGRAHLGHIAGAYLPPDIFARYQRLRGRDVLMVSGSDTHGTPITIRAEEEGITPREVVDRYHPDNVEAFRQLGLTFDLFTETDTENHWAVTQDMFLRLLDNGYIYRDTMLALYCPHCDRWLPDRYVEGTCPHCGAPDARGDQCDVCQRTIDATQLIEPRCAFCGHTPQVRETEHFFLDLAKLNKPLLDWMSTGKEHWRPNVLNFTLNVLESGELRGRPITRDIKWGIPVPVEGYEDKRIYVWFDAVIGYLAAAKEWAKVIGQPEAWREWWQDPDARSYYFIGKDNIPFHTMIWPGMLIGYGDLNLPYDVPANEYLNVEGRKLSKSRRWFIEALDFLTRYAPDPLRYILTINAPERNDVNFTWEEFLRRNNDELVATWGNLANRMLTFAYKNFDKRVPEPGALDVVDEALLSQVESAFGRVGDLLDVCKFKAAITEVMGVAHAANRYLDEKAPWFQIKEDRARAATTVYVILRAIDSLKILFTPFLPFTCQRLHEYLGYEGSIIGRLYVDTLEEERKTHVALRYDASELTGEWTPSRLPVGQALRKPKPLFRKLDESIVEEEIARMQGQK